MAAHHTCHGCGERERLGPHPVLLRARADGEDLRPVPPARVELHLQRVLEAAVRAGLARPHVRIFDLLGLLLACELVAELDLEAADRCLAAGPFELERGSNASVLYIVIGKDRSQS